MDLLRTADALFTGELPIEEHHPFSTSGQLAEIQPGLAFVDAFANSSAVDTDDGLVVVDTSGVFQAKSVHETMRRWSASPLATEIFTHGHIDHVFGVDLYEDEARTNGWAPPRVVAHELVAERFDRYILTAGYNAVINQRQFKAPRLRWPVAYRYPDQTYRRDLALDIGGERFELHHARGETDDGTWVWAPDRRVLFTGDLFIWRRRTAATRRRCSGTRDWAQAFRDGRARRRRCSPRSRPPDRRCRARGKHSLKAPSCWSRCSTRRSRS
jgi:glyoxylase-like metal-dependent hydrolase (beta-lactamase superfamily II)